MIHHYLVEYSTELKLSVGIDILSGGSVEVMSEIVGKAQKNSRSFRFPYNMDACVA